MTSCKINGGQCSLCLETSRKVNRSFTFCLTQLLQTLLFPMILSTRKTNIVCRNIDYCILFVYCVDTYYNVNIGSTLNSGVEISIGFLDDWIEIMAKQCGENKSSKKLLGKRPLF